MKKYLFSPMRPRDFILLAVCAVIAMCVILAKLGNATTFTYTFVSTLSVGADSSGLPADSAVAYLAGFDASDPDSAKRLTMDTLILDEAGADPLTWYGSFTSSDFGYTRIPAVVVKWYLPNGHIVPDMPPVMREAVDTATTNAILASDTKRAAQSLGLIANGGFEADTSVFGSGATGWTTFYDGSSRARVSEQSPYGRVAFFSIPLATNDSIKWRSQPFRVPAKGYVHWGGLVLRPTLATATVYAKLVRASDDTMLDSILPASVSAFRGYSKRYLTDSAMSLYVELYATYNTGAGGASVYWDNWFASTTPVWAVNNVDSVRQVYIADSLAQAITVDSVRKVYFVDSVRYVDTGRIVATVDTLLKDVGATATVDWTEGADTLEGRQPGTWSATGSPDTGSEAVRIYVIDTSTAPDTKINGAKIVVKNNALTQIMGVRTTSTGGFRDFNLDTATGANAYRVSVDLPGFIFTDSAYYTLSVTGTTIDTIYAYTLAPPTIAGSDSCVLNIVTDVPYAEAKIFISDPQSGAIQDTAGTILDRGEIRPRPKANSSGVIQVSLIRQHATDQNALYNIEIFKPGQQTAFATIPKYPVPDSTTATLLVKRP